MLRSFLCRRVSVHPSFIKFYFDLAVRLYFRKHRTKSTYTNVKNITLPLAQSGKNVFYFFRTFSTNKISIKICREIAMDNIHSKNYGLIDTWRRYLLPQVFNLPVYLSTKYCYYSAGRTNWYPFCKTMPTWQVSALCIRTVAQRVIDHCQLVFIYFEVGAGRSW